jgi:lipid-A-disaccharide synthase
MGGPQMKAAGVDIVQSYDDVSVMGFSEAVSALPEIFRIRKKLSRYLVAENVDLFVPIDFPGFNGGVAGKARQAGVPVFWLVAPQHWAWGGWRTSSFRAKVSRLGTILPFEETFFADRGLDVFPMGHPLMDDYGGNFPFQKQVDRREKQLSGREGKLTIGVFPGSRQQELKHLLPVLKVTCQALVGLLVDRETRFMVSAAPGVDPLELASAFSIPADIIQAPLHEVLPDVDLALVCSGTASLEAALAGVPHELVYKTGSFNHWVAKRLVRTGRIGLSNIILEEDLIREHLQDQAAPLPLASDLLRWISRPTERQQFYQSVNHLREMCGPPGVWGRTARELLDYSEGYSLDTQISGA